MTTPQSTPSSMSLTVSIDGRRMTVELYDNAAARDLLGMVPLTVTLRDDAGQEKIASLPQALDTTGAPGSAKPQVGELGYFVPDQVLVLYYGDVAAYPGIERLGRFTSRWTR